MAWTVSRESHSAKKSGGSVVGSIPGRESFLRLKTRAIFIAATARNAKVRPKFRATLTCPEPPKIRGAIPARSQQIVVYRTLTRLQERGARKVIMTFGENPARSRT